MQFNFCAETDEDMWTDWTDFLSLIANLLILISGPVYLILDNPESSTGMDAHGRARGQTAEDDAETARLALQVMSLTAVIGTCVIGMLVWAKVWRELTGDVDESEHAGALCLALSIHLKLRNHLRHPLITECVRVPACLPACLRLSICPGG